MRLTATEVQKFEAALQAALCGSTVDEMVQRCPAVPHGDERFLPPAQRLGYYRFLEALAVKAVRADRSGV